MERKEGKEAGEEDYVPTWWLTFVFLAFLRLRQEDQKFKASPSYLVKPALKQTK